MMQSALPFQIPGIDTYYGGKSGTGTPQAIVNQIPDHKCYIELFLGGGSIARHLHFNEDDTVWLNELDQVVFDSWSEAYHLGLIPIKNVNLSNLNAFDVLKHLAYDRGMIKNVKGEFIPTADTFVFLDPPYVINSRKTPKAVYHYELTDEQHEELIAIIRIMPQKCMITHYPHPIYDELLKDWRKVEFKSITRKGVVTDCMYMNYDPPATLKDYYYLGSDYRERENIRNKTKRWVKKLKNLPSYEQQAIMKALNHQMDLDEPIVELVETDANVLSETENSVR